MLPWSYEIYDMSETIKTSHPGRKSVRPSEGDRITEMVWITRRRHCPGRVVGASEPGSASRYLNMKFDEELKCLRYPIGIHSDPRLRL